MGRSFNNMALLAAILVAASTQNLVAQTTIPTTLVSTPSPTPNSAPSPALSSSPVTYIVGDSLGWTVPISDSLAYQTWAANKTFKVGDKLVFNYTSGMHNVAQVTKAAYGPCNSTNPIKLFTTPPTNITLTTPGDYYFICTYTQHCPLGQHLAINVTGTATPASSPTALSTPTSSGSSSPPSPNTACSLGVAGVSATLLSTLLAFSLW